MVTLNLPHDNLTSMIQIFYCFGLLGSFPMQVLPVFDIYEKTKVFKKLDYFSKLEVPFIKRPALRSLLVIIAAFFAMIVPKFGLFINLIGAFACTSLAFILPVRIYDKLFKDEISNIRKCMHIILVVFGCVVGAISFCLSFYELIKAFSEEDDLGIGNLAADDDSLNLGGDAGV
jgi:amino acid permease